MNKDLYDITSPVLLPISFIWYSATNATFNTSGESNLNVISAIDYEQSLFFFSPSNKTRENAHARVTEGARRERHEQSLFFLSASNKTRENAHARVTEGARQERHEKSLSFLFSGCRPRFSRLAASPLDAPSRKWLTEEKRGTARSLSRRHIWWAQTRDRRNH